MRPVFQQRCWDRFRWARSRRRRRRRRRWGWFFVGGEGDVGAGFEEGFPELGTLPDGGGVGGVVLDDGEDGGCYYAVGAGEVVVDFWGEEG